MGTLAFFGNLSGRTYNNLDNLQILTAAYVDDNDGHQGDFDLNCVNHTLIQWMSISGRTDNSFNRLNW